jgi:hypothetical protein
MVTAPYASASHNARFINFYQLASTTVGVVGGTPIKILHRRFVTIYPYNLDKTTMARAQR